MINITEGLKFQIDGKGVVYEIQRISRKRLIEENSELELHIISGFGHQKPMVYKIPYTNGRKSLNEGYWVVTE